MKTLVTGANGLLGANVVRELIRRGQQVRAFVRRGSDLRSLQDLDVEYYYGDLLNEDCVVEAMRDCCYVIHAAGRTPVPGLTFEDYRRSNILTTKNVVNAVRKLGIKRMVFVSSCCVFGGGSKEDPGTELSEFNGFRFNSGYVNSKYLAHQWILSEVEKHKLPIVVVNPTILLGPYDTHSSSIRIITRILNQRFQYCPDTGKNFIDVRDAAVATCNALTRGTPGESYLLASENLTFSSLYKKVNSIFGNRTLQILLPGIVMSFVGLIGSFLRSITGSKVPVDYSNSRTLAFEAYFSAGKAVRELGLPQRPVDNAIRDAISWFAALNRSATNETIFEVEHVAA